MKKIITNNLIDVIEDVGFSVRETEDCISLQIFSPEGQDCYLEIDKEYDGIIGFNSFADEIYNRYNDFDVSSETMLWLDSDGHGKNGAPYDMIDVYRDMEWFESKILELYDALVDYRRRMKDEMYCC